MTHKEEYEKYLEFKNEWNKKANENEKLLKENKITYKKYSKNASKYYGEFEYKMKLLEEVVEMEKEKLLLHKLL